MRTEAISRDERHAAARAALLVPARLAASALLAALLLPAPAEAAARCGDRAKILERLEQKHHETRHALGLSADGGVLELLVSPEGGWTIMVTYPQRPSCIVAVGKAWQPLTLAGQVS